MKTNEGGMEDTNHPKSLLGCQRGGGVVIPTPKDASNIDQFQQINLLNVEGKVFFSIVAQRMTTYLKQNNLINTAVQKAGIPGFSGCLKHKHDTASTPICEKGRKRPTCLIPRPSQYLWINPPFPHLDIIQLLSHPK